MKEKDVEVSLKEQLKLQGKTDNFYIDLVNDYMSYWKLKEMMITDIKKNGIRIMSTSGNGFKTEKPNESVQNLQKTTATMLKILNDLNLKEPIKAVGEDDYM